MNCNIKFSSAINSETIVKYGGVLFSKLDTAKVLDFHDVFIFGEKAKKKECHKNAQCFCTENDSFHVTHGWLVIDSRPTFNSIKFIAHSVVKSPEGKLLDVTPIETLDPRPFLPAFIDDKVFEDFANWLYQNNLNGSFNYQIT